MKHTRMHDLRRLARQRGTLLAASLCWLSLASAQEPGRPAKPEKPKLTEVMQGQAGQAGGDASKDEMIELFHKVEKRLSEIDKLLYQASAGESALTRQSEAGISELLKNSVSKSQEVTRDIDRILEIAAKNGGT